MTTGSLNGAATIQTLSRRQLLSRLVIKRLAFIPISLYLVVSASFLLIEIMPGDPARAILGSFATDEAVASLRAELGLDRPLHERYVTYWQEVIQGDLGTSLYTRTPITREIWSRLPASIEMVVPALGLALTIGILLGGISAYFRNRPPDRVGRSVITTVQSIPDFFLAYILIFVLFFLLGWLPSPVGRLGIDAPRSEVVTGFMTFDAILAGEWGTLKSALQHLALPVLTLGIVYSAYFAKTTRSLLSGALYGTRTEFARACGLPEWQVVRYALLSVRTPLLTYAAILFASLVGGAAIIEIVFAWRGVGEWGLKAMLALDIPAIQGFIIITGTVTLLVYLLLDVVTMYLDPRISVGTLE